MSTPFEILTFESEDFQTSLSHYWMRVSDQIHLVNRFTFLEWASARVIAGWVPAAPYLTWKCELTRMMWQNMSIANQLRIRKEELSGNTKILIPSETLQSFIQDASRADSFFSFMAGWFLEVNKALIDAYENMRDALDPIFDAPTIDILEEIIPKKRLHHKWANQIVHDAVKDPAALESVENFRSYIRALLLHMGGIDEKNEAIGVRPVSPVTEPHGPAPKKRAKPLDVRTVDRFEPPVEVADNLKIFMWHYMTEIQVVDPMCYVFYGTADMPFEFYYDFSRHIWDETRHHRMGVRRLQQMGFDTVQFTIPYGEDAIKELESYYADLTMVGETCSFTRKRKSMKSYYEKGDILSGMTAEIDIVDERGHVQYGKKWLTELYRNKRGTTQGLDELIRETLDRWMNMDESGLGKLQGNPELAKLSSEEKKSISHFAFCGKIEFKDLNFDRL